MSDQLVEDLHNDTGLSRAAVRSVLWRAQKLGWRVVQTEDLDEGFVVGRRDDCVEIIEEWDT